MPSTRDLKPEQGFRIMALGAAGSGKTTAFVTLSGRKFAYIVDPNSLRSLQGSDIDYELFQPDVSTFNLRSLSASGRKDQATIRDSGSEAYIEWERHFESALESGLLLGYDWVMLDSISTFADMIMDRVLVLNNRAGQVPQQDDYSPVMVSLRNIVRRLCSLQRADGTFVNIYVTGHLEPNKDELTGRIFNTPLLIGKLRQKLPILFSDLLIFEADTTKEGKVSYSVATTPSKMNPGTRCSKRGLPPVLDVTIDWSRPLAEQGLGRFY